MTDDLVFGLYIFALATFVGYQVISRVPPLLHTPLMSGTNAISGISLVGSLVAAGSKHNMVSTVLGFVAVCAATTNVVIFPRAATAAKTTPSAASGSKSASATPQ